MNYTHIPVLLEEVIQYLQPKAGKNYIDATLGGGGYTKEILKHIGDGTVLCIDLDTAAIDHAKESLPQNVVYFHGNFSSIDKAVEKHEFNTIYGIVADIGLSSYQLDDSKRGFSFQKDERLDMRFNPSQDKDASFIVNHATVQELQHIFKEYGEERNASQIARAIVKQRTAKINTTFELNEVIKSALPKPISANRLRLNDVYRKVYQALRISVNDELGNLTEFLEKSLDVLAPHGRLVVVSFHSLEDRIVKQYFNKVSQACTCPPDFPSCVCGKEAKAKIITKKIVQATDAEINNNSRSIPAKLRAIEKL